MHLRSALAAVLAIAPLAAPVAAQADSNDCVVLGNYSDNIDNLVRQMNASIAVGREQDSWDEEQPYMAQAADLARAAASQLHGAASRLISPMYRGMVTELANDYDFTARVLSTAARGGPRAALDGLRESGQRLNDHQDNYDEAHSAACS